MRLAAAVVLGVFKLQLATDLAGTDVTAVFEDYSTTLALTGAVFCWWRAVVVRKERLAWSVMGAGSRLDRGGRTVDRGLGWGSQRPYPSIADALWLAWYPITFAVLLLLVRSRISSFRASLWLDGAIGALSVTALAFAFAYEPITEGATGSTAAVLTNLAYPIGDTLLFGVVVAIFGLTAWRPGRSWLLLGAGLALMAGSDVVYLVQTAQGTYGQDSLVDAACPPLRAHRPCRVATGEAGHSARHRGPARGRGAVRVWARGHRAAGLRPLRPLTSSARPDRPDGPAGAHRTSLVFVALQEDARPQPP